MACSGFVALGSSEEAPLGLSPAERRVRARRSEAEGKNREEKSKGQPPTPLGTLSFAWLAISHIRHQAHCLDQRRRQARAAAAEALADKIDSDILTLSPTGSEAQAEGSTASAKTCHVLVSAWGGCST